MPEKAPRAVPEGMHTITTHLWFNGKCKEAIDFYKKVFGAELVEPPVKSPDGKSIMHAMMKFGNSYFMMADALPGRWEQGPQQNATASMWCYVDDCDDLYDRAVQAGCEIVEEMMDAFWGDRNGKVKDPFGHCWSFASQKWILTDEELQERMQDWLKSLKQ